MAEPYLTMAEIEAKYPNEWVLIDNPNTTKYQQVLGGHVIYHGPDKLALYDVMGKLPTPFNIAVRYIGPLCDEGEEFSLNLGLTDLDSPK
jgi:hypothetical protein